MAEENKTSNTAFEDLMLALFAILLVGRIFQNGPDLLKEHFGIDIGEKQYLISSASLTADTKIGVDVNTPNGTDFYGVPGEDDNVLGTFKPGTALVVADKPKNINDKRWWYVKNKATGETGWVPESALVRDGVGGIGPSTELGIKARAILNTNTWTSPGGLTKAGFLKMGDMGEIIKGPEMANGSRWWFFDKDKTDVGDGWITEAALALSSTKSWAEGSFVKGNGIIDIFEKAGTGRIVGLLEKGEKAKILGGPVKVNDVFWWLIKTKEGEEGWVPEDYLEDAGIKGWFKGFVATTVAIGTMIVFILLIGIIYITIRTNQIRKRELERIRSAVSKSVKPKKNNRWHKVLDHVKSDRPSDWSLAILEADIMLDEVVTKIGYQGQTLGEKLKQATRGDFKSIDDAWEAHKIRNQIAHEGSDFILTQREAKRVISLYSKVFEEFKYI